MRRRALLLPLMLLLLVAPPPALAQTRFASPLTVVLVDAAAVRATSDGLGWTSSLIGLLAGLAPDRQLAVVNAQRPGSPFGPMLPSKTSYATLQSDVEEVLGTGAPTSLDMFDALVGAYNLLTAERAVAGSMVYFVAGGDQGASYGQPYGRVATLLSRFKEKSWTVHGVAFANSSAPVAEFLAVVASGGGGGVFALTVDGGLKAVADHILALGAKGALSRLSEGILTPQQTASSSIDIPPGTREATVVFFKEDPYGSLRLGNPAGLESSSGDRAASYVLETPHVVVWRLIDPMPGTWKVDARGLQGRLSAWQYSTNRYRLALSSPRPVPLGEPALLAAQVLDGETVVAVEGVRMQATVKGPDGTQLTYELNDMGQLGDAAAADGVFSTTIAPLEQAGDYSVALELTWSGHDYRLTSLGDFDARPFPAVRLDLTQTQNLAVGERVGVGSLFVHVQGQPYPVEPAALMYGLSGGSDNASVVEIVPRFVVGQERAWSYDVYLTPGQDGLQRLVFWLRLDYGGRPYTYTTESVVLSYGTAGQATAVPSQASAPTGATPPPAAPASRGFPRAVAAVVGGLLVVVAGALVYLATRTRPYGYLYNDRQELVTDFAVMSRPLLARLLFRDTVSGSELGLSGMEGVVFRFRGQEVEIRARGGAVGVRVNNQPLVRRVVIRDRAWIGVQGRLYSFLMTPMASQPVVGDD